MSATATTARPRRQLPAALLERIAACALLLLALVPRARDLNAGFDRGFEGYQGAFFAMAAVNYERLGVEAAGGYPVLNLELPEDESGWFVYTNHPPVTSLLAWTGARAFGPADWSEAWRDDRAPEGLEFAVRLPFLLMHLLGLVVLWRLARCAFGTQVGLLTLALSAALPVSALYATLVNYENPSLPLLLLAVLAYGAYVREARPRALLGLGLGFAAACSVTFGPAFVLPFLVLRSLWTRRLREALLVGVVGGLGCLLPIALHDQLAHAALDALGRAPSGVLERAQVLLQPLLDGSLPLTDWLGLQVAHASRALGAPLLVVAAVGAALGLARGLSTRADAALREREWPVHAQPDVDLALPLLGGGLLYLFAFYRHTGEEQWTFWLYLAPAAALLAARALHAFSLPLQRLRGGTAPLVLVTGSLVLLGLAHFEAWRNVVRAPGPRDVAGLERGPQAPLPKTAGAALHELLPTGSLGLTPPELGLTPAAAWYAWRTLLPSGSFEAVGPAAGALGLANAPRYVVLPDDPAPSAAPAVELLREALGEPDRRAAGWSAYGPGPTAK